MFIEFQFKAESLFQILRARLVSQVPCVTKPPSRELLTLARMGGPDIAEGRRVVIGERLLVRGAELTDAPRANALSMSLGVTSLAAVPNAPRPFSNCYLAGSPAIFSWVSS